MFAAIATDVDTIFFDVGKIVPLPVTGDIGQLFPNPPRLSVEH